MTGDFGDLRGPGLSFCRLWDCAWLVVTYMLDPGDWNPGHELSSTYGVAAEEWTLLLLHGNLQLMRHWLLDGLRRHDH